MSPILYIFQTTYIPDEYHNSENVILLGDGFEETNDDAPIPIDEIRFMSTIAVLSSKPESVLESFADWWSQKGGGELSFHIISSETAQLTAFRANELKQLDKDGWSIKANFVAYCAQSEAAREAAIEIIRDSELTTH